jgi:flagellin
VDNRQGLDRYPGRHTGSLGDVTTGYLSSLASGGTNSLTSGNLTTAQNILSEAINQVSTLSGRLGAFQKYTIGSTINNLSVAYENAQLGIEQHRGHRLRR